MRYSVIIPTHNRADSLRETLSNLAKLQTVGGWEVIVVDNNSNDHTRAVVTEMEATFPTPLRYTFEAEQGRYAAMNSGIRAAQGELIASTDDDAQFDPDWLNRAGEGLDRFGCDYVGGKVLPIWRGERPKWLPNHGGKHWAVIALLDHGAEPIEFGRGKITWPLGINLVTRREAFEQVGLYNNQLGRKAGTLRNQAQREWHLRARSAGLKGFYIPEMIVYHTVSTDRLSKNYFRRWMYWNGISRAILYKMSGLDMEFPETSKLDFSKVPHIAGVPRYMYSKVLHSSLKMARSYIGRDAIGGFEQEMRLCFYAGMLKQRWKDRKERIDHSQRSENI